MIEAKRKIIVRDALVIGLSIGIALFLGSSDYIESFLRISAGFHWFESLMGGIFFTSAFTTAPAIVFLGKIAQHGSPLDTAFFGAVGALIGDMIIFQLVRDRLAEDFFTLVGQSERRRIRHIFHLRLFRWFTPFIGALIIASPLPDELALMLMGFSKTKPSLVLLFSFGANFLGILGVALASRAMMGI